MDPLTMLLLSAGSGLLTSLFSGNGPQTEAVEGFRKWLTDNKEAINNPAYTKEELNNITAKIQQQLQGASDIVAGRLGSAIGESGIAEGQPLAEYYTQQLAPVIAEGQMKSADIEKWATQLFAQLDENSKQRLLQLAGLDLNSVSMLPQMNNAQRSIVTGLQGMNLGSNIMGNLAQAYKNFNWNK